MTTTAFQVADPNDMLLDGTESYPVAGNAISPEQLQEIWRQCVGLKRHWNCLEKARIVQQVLGRGLVMMGSCEIWNTDFKSSFAYYYNLPLEFHAWVELSVGPGSMIIVDVALPGTIEKALATRDHIGPVVENREPFILAGTPLPWTIYTPRAIFPREEPCNFASNVIRL